MTIAATPGVTPSDQPPGGVGEASRARTRRLRDWVRRPDGNGKFPFPFPFTLGSRKREPTAAERAAPQVAWLGGLWTAQPPSLADLAAYTRAGAWVPGERAPLLEALGKVYGYVIAIGSSVVLYTLAWVIQRPTRLTLTLVLTGLGWWSW